MQGQKNRGKSSQSAEWIILLGEFLVWDMLMLLCYIHTMFFIERYACILLLWHGIMAWVSIKEQKKKTKLLVALPKSCLLSEQCKMLPKIGKATNKEKFLLLLCFYYCIWMAIMAYRFEWRSRPNETREQSSVFSYYRHCHCHHHRVLIFLLRVLSVNIKM